MFSPQQTSTAMELLPLMCLLLTCSAVTSADQNEPGVIRMVVKEDSEAILPCSLGTSDIKGELFDWKKDEQKEVFLYDKGNHYNNGRVGQDQQFKGRVFHFEDQLQFGNASIVIRNTKVTDSGSYTCDFPLPQRKRQSRIELIVDPILKDRTAEKIPGASPEPSVKILNETKDWALLQCVVRGAFPKPKVEWKNSVGNILSPGETQVSERGGSFYITLQTTVTRTDNYRCVATQEEINHQTEADTYVHFNGAASKPSVTILDQTNDGALLQCEVLGASPESKVKWQDSAGKVLDAKEPQVSERGGRYDITLQTTVIKTDRYRCVATQEGINDLYAEIYVQINEFPIGWIVGGVLVTLLVVGVILAVLVFTGCIKITCKKDKKTTNTGNIDLSTQDPLSKSAQDFDRIP